MLSGPVEDATMAHDNAPRLIPRAPGRGLLDRRRRNEAPGSEPRLSRLLGTAAAGAQSAALGTIC